ncbi:MAG TPA: DNA polymerase III subunit gamma/tau [Acidimicrobiia bacterium]|jgi:DNA polymerase-3 subunit gamma/tau
MAFQSLYRKYRPQRFGELVGQEHVTTALRNAVREGRVGHAYLFSGPRGDGKTTTARILAKALNCLDLGADGEPCGQCVNCEAIARGTFNDLVELDAASNNGVDAIRDLVERVSLGLGATSKRKVYIVDEVHMLSTAASNALLKTLEEPPAHVVFVLATTNPEKVLPTIRSRTQHFEFTLLSVEQLSGLVAAVLDDERVGYDEDALPLIARAGGGSARDTLSLLDQVLAHAGERIGVADVESVFGGSAFDERMTIIDAIGAEDVAGALNGVGALLESGHDPRRIAEDLLRSLRDAFLLHAGRGRVTVDATEDEISRLGEVGEALGNAQLVRALETLGQAVVDMRGIDAADPRLVLEIALVRLARRETGGPLQVLADRVDRLEKRLADLQVPPPVSGGATAAPATDDNTAVSAKRPALGAFKAERAQPAPPEAPDSAAAPAGDDPSADAELVLDDVIVAWARVLEGLPRALRTVVQEAQPLAVEGGVVTFGVSKRQIDTVKPRFQKDADSIRQAFITELGKPPRFKFTVHDWTGDGRSARTTPVVEEPPPPAYDDEQPIDLVDPDELVDAPAAGAHVDSISRLESALGATVVEEQPRG